MAYMHADTKPKVGYRPYLQTNPRRASQLSGMQNILGLGELGQNHPFDPWRLHGVRQHAELRGLGQMRPFDQNPGGWTLHGLGLLIDTGGYDPVIDPETGNLWSDEGYATDAHGNVVVDANGNPIFAADLADAVAHAAASAGGAPTVESPAGSIWAFDGTWNSSIMDPLAGLSADGVVAKMTQALQQFQIAVTSSTKNAAYHILSGVIHLELVDNVGHRYLNDVRGILTNVFAQIVGANNVQSSNAQFKSAPGSGAGGYGGGNAGNGAGDRGNKPDGLAWLEENWMLLALAAGALIVAGPASRGIFGGRR